MKKDRHEKYLEQRDQYFGRVLSLGRRDFMKAAGAAAAVAAAGGKVLPTSFQPIDVVQAAGTGFRIAYISDSHLYEKSLNERFVRSLLKAIDDVNALSPAPDFVLYGGDLAQLGQPGELAEGAQMLKALKPPVRMMVGEHDWYLDMGEGWRKHFGKDVYSFDHKGVHFVVLNSVIVEDYLTGPKMTPMERMLAMAQLDNPNGRPFTVGEQQRDWLKGDLARVKPETPVIVFSHSPLYKIYKPWNFWTDDAEEVQKLLAPFKTVSVIHGHTHQMLTHRLGNIHFHGMLSTAWPWPYAPEGLPKLTVRMNRA
ncbi:MAG TPA: metallophosphoesterase, partial [Vicinamibacteria bacterium]|nr:metallophosphoesterase [Vicinamibacteria bacterium]